MNYISKIDYPDSLVRIYKKDFSSRRVYSKLDLDKFRRFEEIYRTGLNISPYIVAYRIIFKELITLMLEWLYR
jgi:hypothetical protein